MPDPIVSYESPDGKIVDIAMSESKIFEDNNKGIKFKKYVSFESPDGQIIDVAPEEAMTFWNNNREKGVKAREYKAPKQPTEVEKSAQQAFDSGFKVKPQPKQQQVTPEPQAQVPEGENIYIGIKTPNGGVLAVDQENETPYFESKTGQRTYFKDIKSVQAFAPAGLTDFFTEQYINFVNKQQAQKEIDYFRGQVKPNVGQGEGYTPDVETQQALTEQKKQRDTEYFIEQASEKYNLFKGSPYQNLTRYAPELGASIQYYSQYAPNGDITQLSEQQISDIQKTDAMAGRPIVRSPKLLQDYADISRRRVNEDVQKNEASIDSRINTLKDKEKEWRKSNAENYRNASGYADIGRAINDKSPYDHEIFQLLNIKGIMNKVKNSAEETDPTFWGEVGRSISNVEWGNIVLAGIPQLADDTYMAQLMIQENKRPETLNENEKQMLKYYRAYQDVQSVTKDSSIETITKYVAESLPLMVSMIITGGFTATVGGQVVKELVKKGAKKGIATAVGFGTEVGLQTALTPYTYDYTAQKIIENPDISNKELLWKTLVNGLATVGIEKAGGLIDPVISRFNPLSVSKQLKGGSKRMFDAISNLQKVPGLNSFVSEWFEELGQVPFTYITEGAKAFDGFKPENLVNTASTLAFMTLIPAGVKGTVIGTSYALDKKKARKQYLQSEVDLPTSIKNEVINYMNAKTPQEQSELSQPLNSILVGLRSPEDRKKVVDYMVNKTTYDYLRFGQEGTEKQQVETQAKQQALNFINNNKAIDYNELIYATDNKTGNNLFVRTLANQDESDLSTIVVIDTVTGEKKQVKLSDITITERMPTTDFYNQIVDYRVNEYATKKQAELSAEDAEDAQTSAQGTVYEVGEEVYIDGRKARIQGETDGQGNYPVVFDTEDGLGESAIVPAITIKSTPVVANVDSSNMDSSINMDSSSNQIDIEAKKADIENRRQEELEQKVKDLKEQRNALRLEDGSIPSNKMSEFKRLGEEINKASDAAQRGYSTSSMLIKMFPKGVDTATSAPEILSPDGKKEAADIIEQVIQGSKSADDAHNKIRRLGYIFDINVTQLLKKYLDDRFNPNAPKVGNNKDSFQSWIYGKYDAELKALEQTAPITEEQTETPVAEQTSTPETISFYHGGLPDNFDINSLDVNRLAEKQQKKGRNYAGFYLYDETQKSGAETYANQTGKSLHKFEINKNAKILELGNIERVTQEQLNEYRNQGYDLIKGKDVRGRTEYVLLNKNIVENVINETPQPKYPTTKDGEVDIDALDDNQLFEYNAETNGVEQAISDYNDEITSIDEQVGKLETKLPKSTTKDKIKIRKQITDLNTRRSNLQSIINQNTPQDAIKEGNITESNQPKRIGVTEPQQGEQTDRVNQETTNPVAETETGGGNIAEQGREVEVITEDEYLAKNGAPFMGGAEPALHKNIKDNKAKQENINRMSEAMKKNNELRDTLRKEYAEKVASGEIRPPTRIETLISTANGDENFEATKASRRILEKKGISWNTNEEQVQTQKPQQDEVQTETTATTEKKESIASAFGVETSLRKQQRDQLNQLQSRAKNALPIVVVNNNNEFFTEIKKNPITTKKTITDAKQAIKDKKVVGGVKIGNTIYLNLSAFRNVDEAVSTWMHEQVGHAGIFSLFPEKKDQDELFTRIFDDIGADEIKAVVGLQYEPVFAKNTPEQQKIDWAMEYVARIAEKLDANEALTPSEQSTWNKIIEYINGLLNAITNNTVKWSEETVMELAKVSAKKLVMELPKVEVKQKTKPKAKVESKPKPKTAEEIKRDAHNKLVSKIKVYNSSLRNTKERISLGNKIILESALLKYKLSYYSDGRVKVTSPTMPKGIKTIAIPKTQEEIDSYKKLSDFPQDFQDFTKGAVEMNASELKLSISPSQAIQAVNNIRDGKTTGASSIFLTELYDMYQNNEIILRRTMAHDELPLTVEEFLNPDLSTEYSPIELTDFEKEVLGMKSDEEVSQFDGNDDYMPFNLMVNDKLDELNSEQRRLIQPEITKLNQAISNQEKVVVNAKKEYESKKKSLNKRVAEETQTNLFGGTDAEQKMQSAKQKTFADLFTVDTTTESIDAVLKPYRDSIATAEQKLNDLRRELNRVIDGVIYNSKSQLSLFNIVNKDPKLVVVHNIKQSGVLNVDKIGGLPMPSLAIVDVNTGFTGYGDITLIADKDLVDPKKDRNAKVFGADVYSPRYPSITYDIPTKGSRLLDSKINSIDNRDLESYVSNQLMNKIQGRGIDDLLNSTASKVLFLKDNGYDFEYLKNEVRTSEKVMDEFIKKGLDKIATYDITDNDKIKKQLTDLYLKQNIADAKIIRGEFIKEDGFLGENLMRNFLNDVQRDIRIKDKVNESGTAYSAERYVRDNNLQAEYEKYINDLYDAMGVEEKIFKGYTPSGTRKYVPHNIDNVIKEMKSAGLRAGESFSYGGLGDLRATFTPQFKSIKDIQNNKGLLQDNIDKAKDELEKEMDELQDKLLPFFKYDRLDGGTMTEELVTLATRGYSESFNKLDTETLNAVREFADKLRNMPTTYFEAKITRAVDLSEFKTALVPEDTSDKVKEVLKRKGLQVVAYSNDADRQDKLKSESLKQEALFNIIGEQGATALDKAEEATTRLDNLGIAKEMEVGGKTPQEIRMATGWEKGVDGKWRYEILDIDTTKIEEKLEKNKDNYNEGTGVATYLGEYVNKKSELFKAYPELKNTDIVIRVSNENRNTASYQSAKEETDAEFGNPPLIEIKAKSISDVKTLLIHEIQHAIQDIEGFAKGGNVILDTDTNAFDLYNSNIREAKAIQQARADFDKTELGKKVLSEMQTDNFFDVIRERNESEDWKVINNAEKLFFKTTGLSSKDYVKKYPTFKKYQYSNYEALAGETEARNAQTRMNYTTEQRRAELLSETADVDPQDQIVIMNALGAMNLEVSPTDLETIKQRAITDGTFMKAPNGQPTNLNERQWLQTRTPEFKAWFGDFINDPENASKVVDSNSEPLVVYHGTNADFTEFEPKDPNFYAITEGWYFFTDNKEIAKGFGNNIMPVFLNIDNPTYEKTGRFNTWNLYDDSGNYGFITEGTDTGAGFGNEYVVENPTQIKSATANVGSFNPSDANIMFNITTNELTPEQKSDYIEKKTNLNNELASKQAELEQAKSKLEAKQAEPIEVKQPQTPQEKRKSVLDAFTQQTPEVVREAKLKPLVDKVNEAEQSVLQVSNDIETLENKTIEKARNEVDKRVDALFNLQVYHGTPHKFDKFSTEYMGTGEGLQAYGWGLYFTDKKSIAESYAKALGDVKINRLNIKGLPIYKYGGRPVDYSSSESGEQVANLQEALLINEDLFKEDLSKAELLEKTQQLFDEYIKDAESELENDEKYYTEQINVYKKYRPTKESDIALELKKNRNLYSVKLHEGKTPDQYDYLRWDKPITEEQKNKIKNTYDDITNSLSDYKKASLLSREFETLDLDNLTGEDIYKRFEEILGSDKDASMALLKSGIDGIKFPTEYLSKGSQEESFNYVIFDENAITIEDRIMFNIQNSDAPDKQKQQAQELLTKLREEVNMLKGKKEKFVYDYQNINLPVRKMQDLIENLTGTKIGVNADVFSALNRFTSAVSNQVEMYANKTLKPLFEKVAYFANIKDITVDDVKDYMLAKHSLERHNWKPEPFTENDFMIAISDKSIKEKKNDNGDIIGYKFNGKTYKTKDELFKGVDDSKTVKALSEEADAEWNVDKVTDIINNFESKVSKEDLVDFWNKVNEATETNIKALKDSGRISIAEYNFYKDRWKYYVPLRGWELTDDMQNKIDMYTSVNFAGEPVRTSYVEATKKAKGRTSKPDDPLPYIQNLAYSSYITAEKNKVVQKLLNLVRTYPQLTDLFEIAKTNFIKKGDVWIETTEIPENVDELIAKGEFVRHRKDVRDFIKYVPDPNAGMVEVYDNGERYMINVKHIDVAKSINMEASVKLPKMWMNTMGWMSRNVSANFTSRNPAFVLKNTIRDVQYAILVGAIETDWRIGATDIARNLPSSAQAISRMLRGKGKPEMVAELQKQYDSAKTKSEKSDIKKKLDDAKDDALAYKFMEYGAKTGFIYVESLDKVQRRINRELRAINANKFEKYSIKAMTAFSRALKYGSEVSENMTRFSVFKSAMEKGYSFEESANMAKNSTTNFNNKGRLSPFFGSLYSFFNAIVQGGANGYSLFNRNKKRGAIAMMMFIVAGAFWQEIARMMAGDDDRGNNKYDLINDYVKQNNIVIPIGENPIIIPLPPMFRMFWGMGHDMSDMVYGKKTIMDGTLGIFDQFINSFSPINVKVASFAELNSPTKSNASKLLSIVRPVTPTIGIPFVDLLGNENYFGGKIYKDKSPFKVGTPESELGMKNVNPTISKATRALNELFGGNAYKSSGYLTDINPSKIEYLGEYYGGGTLKFWNNVYKTVALAVGADIEYKPTNIPIVGSFLTTSKAKDYTGDYINLSKQIKLDSEQYKGYSVDERYSKEKKEMEDKYGILYTGRGKRRTVNLKPMVELKKMDKKLEELYDKLDKSKSESEQASIKKQIEQLRYEFVNNYNKIYKTKQ